MKKFKVLEPIYVFSHVDENSEKVYNVKWKTVGYADSMNEARNFTKLPVLQEAKAKRK